ncbi:MAG: phosphatidate cytidylyltransferase [Pseudomonadota bacterium]
MFVTRLLTAAALLAAFLWALFWLDRAAFSIVAALIVGSGAFEWARLSGVRSPWLAVLYGAACAFLCLSLLQISRLLPWIYASSLLLWLIAVPYWLARGFAPAAQRALPVIGVLVLVPAGVALAAMPPLLALLALGLVWVADTGAYLAGTILGRHKLAPAISPRKTWEGVAGGAIAGLIYAIICAMFTPGLEARVEGAIWVPFVAGTLLLFALSVAGDLLESALKRRAGAKDSGSLLPGHGGVLDRIDSATAVLPAAALLAGTLGA